MPLSGPYCTSKAAVHMLTKIIALENGNGVTCNALLPGIIDTPSNREQMPEANHRNWVEINKMAERIEALFLSEENGSLIDL